MNNKVPLALLLEIFLSIKRVPFLVFTFFFVDSSFLSGNDNFLIAMDKYALFFLNTIIKINARYEKPTGLSYRRYSYIPTHPQNNMYLIYSGI